MKMYSLLNMEIFHCYGLVPTSTLFFQIEVYSINDEFSPLNLVEEMCPDDLLNLTQVFWRFFGTT